MELLVKLERLVQGWLKNVPHLPEDVRKWLGDNVWWLVAIAAVASGIGALGLIVALFSNLSTLSSPFISYYASSTFVVWNSVKISVSLFFTVIECILFAMAVTPLKEKTKKGWVLLFTAWIASALSTIIGAVITLNAFNFVMDLIFGALWLAVFAYFIFEIHGQFAHREQTKAAKAAK